MARYIRRDDGRGRRNSSALSGSFYSKRVERRRAFHLHDLDFRYVEDSRQQILLEGIGLWLRVLVVVHVLVERVANAVRDAALDLTSYNERVQNITAVMTYYVTMKLHEPCLHIDLKLNNMRSV